MSQKFKDTREMANYTKKIVDKYRTFPDTENEAIENLKILFSKDSIYLPQIVKDKRFTKTFFNIVSRDGRLPVLKDLLLKIDSVFYSGINFEM